MGCKIVTADFLDLPPAADLESWINDWNQPGLPAELRNRIPVFGHENVLESGCLIKAALDKLENRRQRKTVELLVVDWLYALIRANIKRGRYFELDQVLKQGCADCLGYAKVFTLLGRYCALDTGSVEVIIDNRGRRIPHSVILVNLSGGERRFIDFWYGSAHIKHRRLGLRVDGGSGWQIADVDLRGLDKYQRVSYLPDYCVDSITLYIRGNRYLKNGQSQLAIDRYSRAIELYPVNTRAFYNRAIAYENLGEPARAREDYTRAVSGETALERTAATQPDEIINLIRLDETGIPELDQQVFLRYRGFVTGRRLSPPVLAHKFGLSETEVRDILIRVTAAVSQEA